MKTYLILPLLVFFSPLVSQELFEFDLHENCSYYGEDITDKIYGFSSSDEAESIIDDILQNIGLTKNFEIKSANVPNAAAVVYNNQRFILYSEHFIQTINNTTGTKWAAISILAHEIGHHLNGHTLDGKGSRPSIELEADKFSGFAMALMGASLEDAQVAIRNIASEAGSSTHPAKSARLEAIAVGYREAMENSSQRSSSESVKERQSNSDTHEGLSDFEKLIKEAIEDRPRNSSSESVKERPSTNDDLSEISRQIKDDAYYILNCNAKPENGGSGSRVASTSFPRCTLSGSKIIFNGTYTASNWMLNYGGTYNGVFDLERQSYTSLSYRLDSGLSSGAVSNNCL